MEKKFRNISFSEVINNSYDTLPTNGDITLFMFDRSDYKKILSMDDPVREAMLKDTLTSKDINNFSCILQGSLSLDINSSRYDLSAGDCFVISQGDNFKVVKASKDIQFFTILNRSGSEESDYIFGINNTLLLLSLRDRIEQSRCFRIRTETMKFLSSIFALMKETLESDCLYKDLILQKYRHILLYYVSSELIQSDSREPVETSSRQKELLYRFMLLVKEHYREERKVKFYADQMCLTPKYLSNIVFETSGRYARKIISDYVITEAKRCLSSTTMTVQEISDYLHFSCQSFFGKYFREHTGTTPQEYRLSSR